MWCPFLWFYFVSSGLIPHYIAMLPLILFSGSHQSRLNECVKKEDPFP